MEDLELRRYRAAIAELRAANLFTSMTNPNKPSLWDILFTDGRPPQYLPFSALFWRVGLLIACFYGAGTWLVVWRNEDIPIAAELIKSLIFGFGMGLINAWSTTSQASDHGLSRWEDLA
jgi:hypothetical protein